MCEPPKSEKEKQNKNAMTACTPRIYYGTREQKNSSLRFNTSTALERKFFNKTEATYLVYGFYLHKQFCTRHPKWHQHDVCDPNDITYQPMHLT